MAGPTGGAVVPRPARDRDPSSTLSPGQWGMLSFLVSEVALFGTLIVTYLFYLGKDVVGPTPAEALSLGLVAVHHGLSARQQRHRPPGGEEAASGATRRASSGGGWRPSCSACCSWWARPTSGTI